MVHSPTEEQTAAISAAREAGSLMISAFAGCAKSSTLEMMAPQIHVPALALAFNKKIATDIAGRLPSNFEVKTLNSLGHFAWSRRLGGRRLKLDDRKIGGLVTEVLKEHKIGRAAAGLLWDYVRQSVSRAMQVGLLPQPERFAAASPLTADTDEEWTNICLDCGTPAGDVKLVCELARSVLVRSVELALDGVICFDDQIYCPVVLGAPWPKFPCVFVDESQDLSPLNHEQLQNVLRPGGRLVAVGDTLQAIYQWRGADAESMLNMRNLSDGWVDLPLTMTFRCPKVVVQRQQKHAKGFRAFEGNRDGEFRNWTGLEAGWELPNGSSAAGAASREGSIAVLCRNNAPLLSLAFKLLRRNVGVVMLGRDIGKGLVSLSRKICPDDELSSSDCEVRIRGWMESEAGAAIAAGRSPDSVEDRGECLLAVLENARDAGQLRGLIDDLFSRQAGRVTLSSIHRAKGLEWDFVVHLDPWRLPSKQALRAGGSALGQEWNLKYVCETRTRDVLVEANLEEMR